MDMLTKKLHSNRGASMLMALLLMLVALMASAVMVSAAVSAANSIREDRAQQQAYLTVSSAAELLRTELEDGKCDGTVTVKTYYNLRYTTPTGEKDTVTTFDDTDGFAKIIKSGIDYLATNPTGTYHETYTIEANDYDTVTAEFFVQMGKDADNNDIYTLTVCFYGGEKPHQCRMYLTAQGKITKTGPTNTSSSEWVEDSHYWWSGGGYYTTKYYKEESTATAWQSVKLQRKVG